MCLGVPGKVIEIDGLVALVDFWGVRKQVRLDVVDEPVAVGDYVLNHVGYAIRRIPGEAGRGDARALRGAARSGADDLMARTCAARSPPRRHGALDAPSRDWRVEAASVCPRRAPQCRDPR